MLVQTHLDHRRSGSLNFGGAEDIILLMSGSFSKNFRQCSIMLRNPHVATGSLIVLSLF